MKAFLREIIGTILLALVIFLVLHSTIQLSIVHYTSMEPTLEPGQEVMVLLQWVAYPFQSPQRGDVIILNPPFPSESPLVKRIIGLPGESIEVKSGQVYIYSDGKAFTLDEPYVKNSFTYSFPEYQIPQDNYFVLGDNRDISGDSHIGNGWTIVRRNIIGKVLFRVWPLNKLGTVANSLQLEQLAP